MSSVVDLSSNLRLNRLVAVQSRFARSVHLGRDIYGSEAERGTYHITPSTHEALSIVSEAWNKPSERAMTLVGPYGAGKSAFAVFLTRLMQDDKEASLALRERDARLYQKLSEDHRLLPIALVGSRAALAPALCETLARTLEQDAPQAWQALTESHRASLSQTEGSPRRIAELFAAAAQAVADNEAFKGILLIIDELGKFLEYAASHPRQSDIFVLQELAEAAARSGETPLCVIGILHQNTEAYAQRLGRTQQAEWAKVAQRFRTVPLFPDDVERMDMVGLALEHAPELHLNGQFLPLAQRCQPLAPPSIAARFGEMARAAYPLHPIALLALPALFRRAGQSHRSLFNFLSGEEPSAFSAFLREQHFDPQSPPLFTLDGLFDYARDSLLTGWSGTGARAWIEAVEAVERAEAVLSDEKGNASSAEVRALKCIGLLNWLRDAKLPASRDVLNIALGEEGEAALRGLEQRKLIMWSRLRHAYRLWEGGDVDVEAELESARVELTGDVTLALANDPALCPMPRPIARRHSFETGTLRGAAVVVGRAGMLPTARRTHTDELAVLLCLAATQAEAIEAEEFAREMSEPNLLIGIAVETDALREAAFDLAAAGQLPEKVEQLEGDRAARRELDLRRSEAETLFRDEWNRLFGVALGAMYGDDTSESSATWFYNGESRKFEGARNFSAFLSEMADVTFSDSPRLRNELLNRRQLSSAGASARRTLITAMLERGELERLGIESFPPELSMYESALHASGLHVAGTNGRWQFAAPDPQHDKARLLPAWKVIEEVVFGEADEVALSALFDCLRRRPFGVTEGVLPVLLCAFLQVHERETALYKEGTFIAEPKAADWELLLRRPDLFAVAGCRVEGTRRVVVERLAQSLSEPAEVVPLVRRLLKMIRSLPEHAWKTRRLSASTLRVRESLENARSPERLLFKELPLALGLMPLGEEDADETEVFFGALNSALGELAGALARTIERARDEFLRACALPPGEAGWKTLRDKAMGLAGRVSHPQLVPLFGNLNGESDTATVESVLTLIAQRAPKTWRDADVDTFASLAAPFGKAFRDALSSQEETRQTPSVQSGFQHTTTSKAAQVLSAGETEAAQKLSKRLEKQLAAKDGTPLPRHVQRAAVWALLQKIDEEKAL